jgi:hypothetical protein
MGHNTDIINVSGKHSGRPRRDCEEFILGLIFCLFGEVAECTNKLKTDYTFTIQIFMGTLILWDYCAIPPPK